MRKNELAGSEYQGPGPEEGGKRTQTDKKMAGRRFEWESTS